MLAKFQYDEGITLLEDVPPPLRRVVVVGSLEVVPCYVIMHMAVVVVFSWIFVSRTIVLCLSCESMM